MGDILTGMAVLLLVVGTCRDAEPGDRTPGQLAAAVRAAAWWRPAWWLACLLVGGLAVPFWYACRFALYTAAYLLAAVSVRVATAAALDGRGVRIYRTSGGRALVGRPA